MTQADLDLAQLDRAAGAVLGSACGDALGAGYEFESAPIGPSGPEMIGGGLGNFAPGEWTDDTSMTWGILEVAARASQLVGGLAGNLDGVAANFRAWFDSAPADIGNQTRYVLETAGAGADAATMTQVAQELHRRTNHTGGNGSLMRTAAVALSDLADPDRVAGTAARISALTHPDPDAQEACILWSLAIREAILTGRLDIEVGLPHLARADLWRDRIAEAESAEPTRFNPNGWVVTAFQAAWSAIRHAEGAGTAEHLANGLRVAIGVGNDTDTVAAISGALLGATYGATAVPARWRRMLHGYPGLTGEDLVALAQRAVG